ncbi:ATP-binding protein [Nonomuraea pusilla]|uniref:ATP-binding protein n=1 Tax=Nonomuraea pusilla TaxID=46177 RepID=UPI00332028BB
MTIGRIWDRLAALMSVGSAEPEQVSWKLRARPTSVAKARRLTRDRLAFWGHDGEIAVVELLVSELVTNALRRECGPVRLSLSVEDGLLRCEVEDADPELPCMRAVWPDDESGRGLHLVDMLACCWGSVRTLKGKVVWFEFPVVGQCVEQPLEAQPALAA